MISRPSTNNNSQLRPHILYLPNKGFTLIEIIIVLAVISILIAILVPVALKYIEDARITRAQADTRAIAAAVNSLMKDTGQYPGDRVASTSILYLITDGNLATGTPLAVGGALSTSSNTEDLSTHLLTNTPGATVDYTGSGRFRWKGPYLNELTPDPWGNRYVVVPVQDLKGNNTNAVWVLSAGPDGVFDTTSANATTASDDDIGIRIK